MTGCPDGAGSQLMPSNLSAPVVASWAETAAWPAPSTLTQNEPIRDISGQLVEDRATKKPTNGGSNDTGTNVPTERPEGAVADEAGDNSDTRGDVAENLAEPLARHRAQDAVSLSPYEPTVPWTR